MKMLLFQGVLIVCSFVFVQPLFEAMDDTRFEIDWPGPLNDIAVEDLTIDEKSFLITSENQEKFYCVLPTDIRTGTQEEENEYKGPQEYQLLTTLFDQTTCSYRIESYWTYELCHGRHIRQYHEDKELKQHKPKLQEYYLGVFDRLKGNKEYMKQNDEEKQEETEQKIQPTMRLDNMDYAYFEMNFTSGAVCDLTGKERRASVRYICHEDGHGEMYDIKETSSCEYEVIVLTYLLCNHPNFKQKVQAVNKIACRSLNGAPSQPKSLKGFQEDYSRASVFGRSGRHKWFHQKAGGSVDVVARYQAEDKTTATSQSTTPILRQTTDPKDTSVRLEQREPTSSGSRVSSLPPADENLVREFLRGDYCITGGTGWWKHEFCFNKMVLQFHEAKNKPRQEIVLGNWHEDAHLQWLASNPTKRPKQGTARKTISHYYTQGDICDITKKPRVVEVKLKCKENPSHPQSVSIYLVEPSVCEYVLVVESPVMCPLITHADDNGLVQEYVDQMLQPAAPKP